MFVCRADKGSRRAIERRHQGTALRGCCAFLYGDPSTSTSATLRMTTRLSRHSISICRHRSTYGLHHQVILSEGLCPQSKDLRTNAYFIQTNSCKTAECVRLCGDSFTIDLLWKYSACGIFRCGDRNKKASCRPHTPLRYAQNDNPFVSP